jgi:hypothetical protein
MAIVFGRMALKTSNHMKKNLGNLLLAIYLIIIGAMGVFHISLGQLSIVVPVLAIAAGVCLILGK